MTQPTDDVKLSIRTRAASISLVTALALTVGKVLAASATGSVGMFSEGIHSGLDLLSAAIAFFTIREAVKPADTDHPFGHGKIETLSSLLEALLLVIAAIFIFHEAIDGFRQPREVHQPVIAMVVIAISLGVNFAVYFHNAAAAKATESRAIEVNALHFLADAVTSLGVLIALVLIAWTGYTWIDPLVAGLVGAYILVISWGQISGAVRELTDTSLPAAEVSEIEKILGNFAPRMIGIHALRTRRSGVIRHVEFHLALCGRRSVSDSHELNDEMEEGVRDRFPGTRVTIHVEPCGHHDRDVPSVCPLAEDTVCEYRRKKGHA